jgi:cytochrome c oxidase subunit II
MATNIQRRQFLIGTAVLGFSAVYGFAASQPQAKTKVISVVAKKFEYSPSEIRLKMGETVVLELISQDVVMGFNAPDFKTRADIIPGVKTRVSLTPNKVGEFTFYCDIFCGDGHENMTGTIIVS